MRHNTKIVNLNIFTLFINTFLYQNERGNPLSLNQLLLFDTATGKMQSKLQFSTQNKVNETNIDLRLRHTNTGLVVVMWAMSAQEAKFRMGIKSSLF